MQINNILLSRSNINTKQLKSHQIPNYLMSSNLKESKMNNFFIILLFEGFVPYSEAKISDSMSSHVIKSNGIEMHLFSYAFSTHLFGSLLSGMTVFKHQCHVHLSYSFH